MSNIPNTDGGSLSSPSNSNTNTMSNDLDRVYDSHNSDTNIDSNINTATTTTTATESQSELHPDSSVDTNVFFESDPESLSSSRIIIHNKQKPNERAQPIRQTLYDPQIDIFLQPRESPMISFSTPTLPNISQSENLSTLHNISATNYNTFDTDSDGLSLVKPFSESNPNSLELTTSTDSIEMEIPVPPVHVHTWSHSQPKPQDHPQKSLNTHHSRPFQKKMHPTRFFHQIWLGRNEFFFNGKVTLLDDVPMQATSFLVQFLSPGILLGYYLPIYAYGFELNHQGEPISQSKSLNLFFIIFTVSIILYMYVFYFATILTPPGYLPRRSEPLHVKRSRKLLKRVNREEVPNKILRSELKTLINRVPSGRYLSLENGTPNGQKVSLKYCETCQLYRPIRSSHCSYANTCIHHFDHSCLWLNQAIGERNYRYFFLYLTMVAFNVLEIMGLSIYHMTQVPIDYLGWDIGWLIIAAFCFFTVGNLTSYHYMLVFTGRTTHEEIKSPFSWKNSPFSYRVLAQKRKSWAKKGLISSSFLYRMLDYILFLVSGFVNLFQTLTTPTNLKSIYFDSVIEESLYQDSFHSSDEDDDYDNHFNTLKSTKTNSSDHSSLAEQSLDAAQILSSLSTLKSSPAASLPIVVTSKVDNPASTKKNIVIDFRRPKRDVPPTCEPLVVLFSPDALGHTSDYNEHLRSKLVTGKITPFIPLYATRESLSCINNPEYDSQLQEALLYEVSPSNTPRELS